MKKILLPLIMLFSLSAFAGEINSTVSGVWYSAQETEGLSNYIIVNYMPNGNYVSKEIIIDYTNKKYCILEDREGSWTLKGKTLIQKGETTGVHHYTLMELTDSDIKYYITLDGGMKLVFSGKRESAKGLPTPPSGFSKVSFTEMFQN
jgi:hypothetical protein